MLGSEYADRGVVLAGPGALRAEIAELAAGLDEGREIEPEPPHRQRAPALIQRLARRILDARLEWPDEVERAL